MKKLSNLICAVMAGAMALGIIISLIVVATVIANLCSISMFSSMAIVGITFFITVWIIIDRMFSDIEITFNGDDEDEELL